MVYSLLVHKSDSVRQLCWSSNSCHIKNYDAGIFYGSNAWIQSRMGMKIHTAGNGNRNGNSFVGVGGNSLSHRTDLYTPFLWLLCVKRLLYAIILCCWFCQWSRIVVVIVSGMQLRIA